MNHRRSSDEMFPLIASWETSGISQESFCNLHGLSIGTFSYWRKKYQQQFSPSSNPEEFETGESRAGFIPITVNTADLPSNSSPVLEIHINSVQLRFYQLPSANWLAELIG